MNPAKLNPAIPEEASPELEVHPLIELLIARMESHPKEFYKYDPNRPSSNNPNPSKMNGQASHYIEGSKTFWNREEKRLYNLALRKIRMDEAHERLMHLLLVR